MRKSVASMALCLCLGIVAPASAQTGGAGWAGVTPRPVHFTPANTAGVLQPRNVSSALKTPTQPRAFSLGNIFHPITLPSFPPRHAVPATPSAAQMQMYQSFQKQQQQRSALSQFFQPIRNILSPY